MLGIGVGMWGMWEWGGNAGNQGRNAGNRGGNAGNHGGNAGSRGWECREG